ncbi:deubiquitinase OTUD6B-like isoform X2 [Gordionus sp. m RMFG-2023]|uniref:deubiquitinase OTUD6B-like isoform X2 n=1 Tax=Gordionus sp. m RMFG-2023 TaxID=3053472 RepID=UPI0031FE25B6
MNYENLLERHKQEKLELQKNFQKLKHTVPQNEKKRRKEILIEISKLENELKIKHENELEAANLIPMLQQNKTLAVEDKNPLEINVNKLELNNHISRAQRRKNKKTCAEDEKKKQLLSESKSENIIEIETLKNHEDIGIKDKLKYMNAQIYEVPANGDCLYHSISHQLALIKDIYPQNITFDIKGLRLQTSDYMKLNFSQFIPFMSDDLSNQNQYVKYCDDIAQTNCWGGHLEIQALSQVLQHPIHVIQSNAPNIIMGEEFEDTKPPLYISYHRYLYTLGEHYNSVCINK